MFCAVAVALVLSRGYEGYGELQTVGESLHQSCLVLTSRENPRKWHHWKKHYKSLVPTGMEAVRRAEIFKAKGLSSSRGQIGSLN